MSDSDFEDFFTIIGYLFLAILIFLIILSIIKKIIQACKKASLVHIMKAKLQNRNASIDSIKLPPINLQQDFIEEVLNSDVTNLKRFLDMRKLTSVDLLCIYFKRAITIGLDHALITEVNFEESLKMAKECDRIRATKYANMPIKDKEGLLFGIPISIKDLFEMKDFECNYGCGALCNNPKKEDGYAVKLLREEGAIPFVRSNIPQVGFAFECWNGVYGRGLNPWNKSRTPGGSSGGEAGLVAARCSPMGLGSDMGGSIRCPANFCGVYGFKPSSTRVSKKGCAHLTKAFEGLGCFVPVSIGPLAKSSDDVELMMKCLLNERFHRENKNKEGGDPYFIPIPWNEKLFMEKKQFRIGYLKNNDLMPVSAAYIRAIDETADALRSNGHTMIEVEINFLDSIQGLYYQSITADPNLGIFADAVQEQGMDAELFQKLSLIIGLPIWLKSIIGSLAKCLGMPRVAALMKSTNPKTAHELLELMDSIKTLKEKFMKWWNIYNLDALILPNLGMPAFKHGFSGDISVFGAYAMLGNLMDLPCGAIPITVVGENETIYDERIRSNKDMIAKKAQENLNESQGMPVGVQVITPFQEEERCVNLMKQIEEKIKFHQKNGFAI